MTNHRLGTWHCPSGQTVDADLVPVRDGVAMVVFTWETPPPFSPDDEHYYRIVIRPEVIRRVKEYQERTGRALVVEI